MPHKHRRRRRNKPWRSRTRGPRRRERIEGKDYYNTLIGESVVYESGRPSSSNYWKVSSRSTLKYLVHRFAPSQQVMIDYVNNGPPYKAGQELTLCRIDDDGMNLQYVGKYRLPNTIYGYDGGWVCTVRPEQLWANVQVGSLTESKARNLLPADVNDYGATGWAKARPGQPTADLAVFLAELREMPRLLKDTANFFADSWKALKTSRGSIPKKAANDWLAANFGWLPFVSDLRKFAKTTATLDKSIQQLKRDNGRWVRRRRTVLQSIETELDSGWVNNSARHTPLLNTYWYAGTPYTRGRTVIERYGLFWFVGKFRYWIPDIGTSGWTRQAKRRLFGASLTPAVVWELVPFSWLVDWCSNVGDVIANLDNNLAENLVAEYAYIMGTQRLIASFETQFNWKSSVTVPRNMISHMSVSLKERSKASPFGFGLTGMDFSARQWSLLTALGLQRLKFT